MAVGAKLRYEVLRRDNYTCRFCGSAAPDVLLEIDHVIPRSAGGMDVASNLQVLCEECNAGKSATMPERWLVREVVKAARRRPDPPGDDYSEMYAYLDARFFLESLTAEELLYSVTRVLADVYPYRPDESQLVIAMAKFARSDLPAGAEVSC